MTTEFNELLPVSSGEKTQIWSIGSRDQVTHTMNEFYIKRIATDRVGFTPIVPATPPIVPICICPMAANLAYYIPDAITEAGQILPVLVRTLGYSVLDYQPSPEALMSLNFCNG